MDKRCEQTLLACGEVSEVLYCRNCRVFHVNVGPITVHVDAPTLRELSDVLARALAAHERMKILQAAVPRPPADVH
jgi:hypothetical protein